MRAANNAYVAKRVGELMAEMQGMRRELQLRSQEADASRELNAELQCALERSTTSAGTLVDKAEAEASMRLKRAEEDARSIVLIATSQAEAERDKARQWIEQTTARMRQERRMAMHGIQRLRSQAESEIDEMRRKVADEIEEIQIKAAEGEQRTRETVRQLCAEEERLRHRIDAQHTASLMDDEALERTWQAVGDGEVVTAEWLLQSEVERLQGFGVWWQREACPVCGYERPTDGGTIDATHGG